MEDYFDILKQYKSTLVEEGFEANITDTMGIIEDSNAKITKDSKKYKEASKYIFKEDISYENAEKLVKVVKDYKQYDVYNLREYKENINQELIYCFEQGENPIEMLIFSIRELKEKIYVNAIHDVIKDFISDYREFIISSYKNILKYWVWGDCIETVLLSIKQNYLKELQDEVYEVFENRYNLRVTSARVLMEIKAESKYISMINFLLVNTSDSREDTGIMKNIAYELGRDTEYGSMAIYKIFTKVKSKNPLKTLLMLGIRNNLTKEILQDMEKKLQSPKTQNWINNYIIDMLIYAEKNKKSRELLEKSKNISHLDKKRLSRLYSDDFEKIKEVILNKNENIERRKNEIINLAKLKEVDAEDKIAVISEVYDESDIIQICAASALVEIGEEKKIILLVKYLIGVGDENLKNEAMNQIRRLKSMGISRINRELTNAIGRFMKNDDSINTKRALKIIEIYVNGLPDEAIGTVFIEKLSITEHKKIKEELLMFFSKNYTVFSKELKVRIKEEMTKLTRDKAVYNLAMESIKRISPKESHLPEY